MCALEWARSDGHNDHMKRKPLRLPPNTVGVAEAKRDLARLIDAVLRSGTPILIARRGRPVARLEKLPRDPGLRPIPGCSIPESSPFWKGLSEIRKWRLKSEGRYLKGGRK